jgi:uncharacterized membrane protein
VKRFIPDQGGNMAVLFALAISLSGVIGAIAIDAGALYHERRGLQSAVDIAALSAAMAPIEAPAIVRKVLADAGLDPQNGLTVRQGRYDPDPAKSPAQRFVAGASPYNAVQVHYQRPGTLHFGSAFAEAPLISAEGLATATPEISFSIGSRLASLNGGIANAVLSKLLGTSVSLSALDYNNLAAARVDVLDFLDSLSNGLSVEVGSYDELLASRAHTGEIAAALARIVTGADRAALNLIASAGKGGTVPLEKLFDLGRFGRLAPGGEHAALGVDLSVLEILSAAAALADGERQVSLALGGSLPGLASLSVDLAIGEPPQGGGWFRIGPVNSVIRTAQLRLRIDTSLLGGLILQNAVVRLPLWLDLAHAEARVGSVTCPSASNPNGTAQIEVRPGALQLAVGIVSNAQLRNFGARLPVSKVRILDALLLRIEARGLVEVAQTTPIILNFTSSDIGAARLKAARMQTAVTSLATSLLDELDLDISVLGIGLSPVKLIEQTLRALILPVAGPLDQVINSLLATLGQGVGEADVRVYGIRCGAPVLVG